MNLLTGKKQKQLKFTGNFLMFKHPNFSPHDFSQQKLVLQNEKTLQRMSGMLRHIEKAYYGK
jgi:hypothetical protein